MRKAFTKDSSKDVSKGSTVITAPNRMSPMSTLPYNGPSSTLTKQNEYQKEIDLSKGRLRSSTFDAGSSMFTGIQPKQQTIPPQLAQRLFSNNPKIEKLHRQENISKIGSIDSISNIENYKEPSTATTITNNVNVILSASKPKTLAISNVSLSDMTNGNNRNSAFMNGVYDRSPSSSSEQYQDEVDMLPHNENINRRQSTGFMTKSNFNQGSR